ncbi:MAG: hypothetical protein AB1798_03990 [Spirochaetota bacterium]
MEAILFTVIIAAGMTKERLIWEQILPGTTLVVEELSALKQYIAHVTPGSQIIVDFPSCSENFLSAHLKTITDLLDYGCSVIMEPPIEGKSELITGLISVAPRRKKIFFRNSLIYRPLFLELKRSILEGKYGNLQSMEINHFIRDGSPNEKCFNANLQLLYWLFGKPEGSKVWKEIGQDGRILQICGVVWYSHCAMSFSLSKGSCQSSPPDNSLSDNYSGRGYLAFEKGEIEYIFGRRDSFMCRPSGSPGFKLPLPEGNGELYVRKDVVESLTEKRGSDIFPLKLALSSLAWFDKVFLT